MNPERKRMLDKLIVEIVEEMYQAEKLSYEESRLIYMVYEKENPCRLLHCRTVLNTYKTLSNIYGLENK